MLNQIYLFLIEYSEKIMVLQFNNKIHDRKVIFPSKLGIFSILAFNLINVYINSNLLVTCSAEAFQREIIYANVLLLTSP